MTTTEESIRNILINIGEDPDREDLQDTPMRVAKVYDELLKGYKLDPKKEIKTFTNEEFEGMVCVKDIEYFSMCEHHMLPFFGLAHIAYIPNGKISGLSKFARLVEIFSRRLQNQERLTSQIGNFIFEELKPKGVAVSISGKHLCMNSRGVNKPQTETVTNIFLGDFKKDLSLRSEFLSQIK